MLQAKRAAIIGLGFIGGLPGLVFAPGRLGSAGL